MNLLLLSNSTNHGSSYLEHCASQIDQFLADKRELLLIPYAAVTYSYDEYEEMASNALSLFGIKVRSIHKFDDPVEAVRNAQAIAIAGGNTFRLLDLLYAKNLVAEIRSKVTSGTPYIGWSAGSNVAGPTIKTTNDMPIAQPPTFDALGLVKFQINPHYTDRMIVQHKGETRAQRLAEFVELNRNATVIALPEGSWLQQKGNTLEYHGSEKMVVFTQGQQPQYVGEEQANDILHAFV